MHELAKSYATVKPAIVAIVGNVSTNPHFPPIVGTGFIADPAGIVVTNDHVIRAIPTLPRPPDLGPEDFPASVIIFHQLDDGRMATAGAKILGVAMFGGLKAEPYAFRFDIGIIRIDVCDLPTSATVRAGAPNEGDDVAVAGFPLGTDLLMAQSDTGDRIGQVSPTVRRGVIAAVLPFPGLQPSGLLLDIPNQGGSSGSPVFDVGTGDVVGLNYGGVNEPQLVLDSQGKPIGVTMAHSGLTLAVPGWLIADVARSARTDPDINADDRAQRRFAAILASTDTEMFQPSQPS